MSAVCEVTLSHSDRTQYNLPPNGVWYFKQDDMLQEWQTQGSVGFTVAWDKYEGRGNKVYGLYKDANEFYVNLADVNESKRCGYELIPRETSCKFYADVEWEETDADIEHVKIKSIVQEIRRFYKKFSTKQLSIYVSCSSRKTKNGLHKNSYHLTSPDIVFSNNHDGTMEKFTIALCEGNEYLHYTGPNDELLCYIDLRVYTQNRCIRLPYCSKMGSRVVFRRISGPPTDLNDHMTYVTEYDMLDPESWRPFIITDVDAAAVLFEHEALMRKHPAAHRLAERPPKRSKTHGPAASLSAVSVAASSSVVSAASSSAPSLSGDSNDILPINTQTVQNALAECGDTVSRIASIRRKQNELGKYWQLQCNQSCRTRRCLHDPSLVHESNNCILFVKFHQMDSEPAFVLEYHCTSEHCKKKHLILGYFVFSRGCMNWKFVKEQSRAHGESSSLDMPPINIQSDDPYDNTYELVKKRFEAQVFRVKTPFVYATLTLQRENDNKYIDMSLLSHSDMMRFYTNIYYFQFKDRTPVKTDFIKAWIRDPNMLTYNAIVVDPSGKRQDVYNMWKGYLAERQPLSLTYCEHAFPDEDTAKEFAMRPIYNHLLDVVCNGNRNHTEWILDWLANIVQKPWQRTEVAISIYGEQGCGKGVIFEWMRKQVLGHEHTYQTTDPERELFGKFSLGLVNKVLVQVDEVKNLHSYSDQLKNAITSNTVNFEKKCKDPITVDAYANFIFTSNNENALKIPGDDRRFVLFRSSSMYRFNRQYFNTLVSHLYADGVAAWFLKFLKDRDVAKYRFASVFQDSRPLTSYYVECQRACIPVLRLFLSAYANGDGDHIVNTNDLFQHYLKWMNDQNLKFFPNLIAFSRDIGRIEVENGGITCKKDNMKTLTIDKNRLKAFLKDKKHYDDSLFFLTTK